MGWIQLTIVLNDEVTDDAIEEIKQLMRDTARKDPRVIEVFEDDHGNKEIEV